MRRVASAILLAGLLGAGEMSAGDHGFDRVVRNIESEYGARRLGIPLLGLVNAIVKVARPSRNQRTTVGGLRGSGPSGQRRRPVR